MAEETASLEEEPTPDREEERKGSGPGFILGTLLGLIVGAAAATLFAPATGEEIRHRIAEETSPMRGYGEEEGGPEGPAAHDTPIARMRSLLEQVRSRVREASEEAGEAAREAEELSHARYAELTHKDKPSS